MTESLSSTNQDALRDHESRPERYCIVSPCRNEAAHMRRTLDSVAAQSARPGVWVIVDDGSTDETPEILEEYRRQYDFIEVVRASDRGDRKLGGGVIDAFYLGLDTIELERFDFVCKLDMDLDLPERYFESLMRRMDENPRLATCSGKPYYENTRTGELVSEGCGDENAVGASKFYRVAAFEQIGGFVHEVMWDGIDGHRCRMAGWIARSWDDEEIRFLHLRPMGSSHRGVLTGRARHGRGQFFMGTHPVYMLIAGVYRMLKPPVLLGGAAMILGYFRAFVGRQPRYGDEEFRRFLRKYQWNCLLRGKAKATAALEGERRDLWESDSAAEPV